MNQHTRLHAVGVVTLEKFRIVDGVAESTPYAVLRKRNALTTAGRQQLLNLATGISAASPLDANSVLKIKNNSGVLVKQLTGTETGYPLHATGTGLATLQLRWRDGSADIYPAYQLEVYFSGGTIQLNTLTPNYGNKPSNEAWVYTFTLTLSAGSSALTAAGLDLFLKCISATAATPFDATRTQLQVYSTWDGSTGTISQAFIAPTSGPIRTNETVTWTWILDPSQAVGTWAWVKVQNSAGAVVLRSGTTAAGSKGSFVQRTYSYSVSL